MPREELDHNVEQSLRDICQAIHLLPLRVERLGQTAVVVSHLRELSGNLSWKLYALLQGRVWLERLTFDFLQ